LGKFVAKEVEKTLAAYSASPKLIDEHVGIEKGTAGGGYAHRQIFELVQNSADALSLTEEASTGNKMRGVVSCGRIMIHLANDCLYCADDGMPIDEDGVVALMFSYLSPKQGTDQIGTFGLGFKSILSVSDAPEFYSRTVSLRFDGAFSRERVQRVMPNVQGPVPVLRLPEPVDPAIPGC